MKAILITTRNKILTVDVEEPLYKSVGTLVGGFVEHVNPRRLDLPYCMLCNDSGLIAELSINIIASYLYETDKHGCPIAGNVVIMKEGEEDWEGLNDLDLLNMLVYLHGIKEDILGI